MYFRVSVLILGVALFFSSCSSGPKYATNKSDDSYDLTAMALAEEDLPVGYLQQDSRVFNNQDWAPVVAPPGDDPQATQKQLDALGRITGAATLFSWVNPEEHLGRPFQIATQSTLYTTANDASKSLKLRCDLPIDPTSALTDFKVAGLGDESTGFMSTQQVQGFGGEIDTAVCFRTGRIVHAVFVSGLEGTQDIAMDVRLAKKMLSRVEDALTGSTRPPTAIGKGSTPSSSPAPSSSPSGSNTAPTGVPVATPVATGTPKAGN